MTAKQPLSQRDFDFLAEQVATWRSAGLVSEQQAAQIFELYETAADRHARRHNWLLATVSALAVLLFGAAVLLVVSYNWAELSAAAKLAILFAGLAATYGLALFLRYGRGALVASEVVLLFGCLLYGASIWLIAQIFHISAHYPDGTLWWAVGVLPLAFLLDSIPLHLLLVALVATWCGQELIGFAGLGGLLFGWRLPVPNGCYLALAIALAGLWLAYRTYSAWRVSLYAALLVWWVVLQPVAWRWEGNMIYFLGAVGALLLVVAESHARGSLLAIPYRLYGTLLFGGVLVPMSFWDFNRHMPSGTLLASATMTGLIIVLAAATFSIAEWVRYVCLEKGQAASVDRLDDIRRRQWLPLALVALMAGLSFWSLLGADVRPQPAAAIWLPVLAANAAMVALAVWLMWVGLREDRAQPFAAGVAYFLLWTIVRYIDLFGRVGGMLGAALLFFLCGCLLLGIVAFWRQRKRVEYV